MNSPRELVPFDHDQIDGSRWTAVVTRQAIDDGVATEGEIANAQTLEQQVDWVDRNVAKLGEIAVRKIEAGLVDDTYVYVTAADWADR